MSRRLPPPLPWEPGGRPPGKPASWEEVSHYPGYTENQGHVADPVEGSGDPAELHWIPVGSSNVAGIAWMDGADYKLFVKFKDHGDGEHVYAYDAPEAVYDEMFSASSAGRFVHSVLKGGGYPYRKVY